MRSETRALTFSNAFIQTTGNDFRQFLSILSTAFDMYDTQFRFLRPDGKEITLRESGRGLFDARGRLARVIGITADVTEQVAARKDLEQSQTDLLQLIQRLPMAVAIANANGRIEYINNRFTRDFWLSARRCR